MGYPSIAYRAGAGLLRRAAPGFQREPSLPISPRLPRPWTPSTFKPTGPAANDNVRKLWRLGGSFRFRIREAWDLLKVAEDLANLMWPWSYGRLPANAGGWTIVCSNPANVGVYRKHNQCSASWGGIGPDTAYTEIPGNSRNWFVNRGRQPHPFGSAWFWGGSSAWKQVPWSQRNQFPGNPFRPIYVRYRREWAEPSWIPAWIPMSVPPLAPQPAPAAVPYPAIPKLDPNPDFPEAPRRGNEWAPAPRPVEFPWPAGWPDFWGEWFPGEAPPLVAPSPRPVPGRPVIEPPPAVDPDPAKFPIRAVIEWMSRHNPDGSPYSPRLARASRPKFPSRNRQGKEKKIRSQGLAALLHVAARWQSSLADYNDMVDALYDALPKGCRDKHGGASGASAGRTTGSNRRWNYRNTTDEGRNLVSKQVAIMKCWDRMDVAKAVSNVAREIMEDLLGAAGDKLRGSAAEKTGQPKVKYDIRSPGIEF